MSRKKLIWTLPLPHITPKINCRERSLIDGKRVNSYSLFVKFSGTERPKRLPIPSLHQKFITGLLYEARLGLQQEEVTILHDAKELHRTGQGGYRDTGVYVLAPETAKV